jgi:hypothetical protein
MLVLTLKSKVNLLLKEIHQLLPIKINNIISQNRKTFNNITSASVTIKNSLILFHKIHQIYIKAQIK